MQKNYQLAASSSASAPAQIAEDYANRLKKNMKKLDKWARQEGIECYRLYDADLPEYNVAVDRYADWVVIQEYAPPKTIDALKARQRLFDVISATLTVLELPANRLVLKTREKQKGKSQYQKLGEKGEYFEVREFNARFWVNLTDYLDTGLFIDHRLARRMLGQMSKGKDFLTCSPIPAAPACMPPWRGALHHHGGYVAHLSGVGGAQYASQRPERASAPPDAGGLPELAARKS